MAGIERATDGLPIAPCSIGEKPMQNAQDATTGTKTGDREAANRERVAMMNVDDVAGQVKCSTRTAHRLADSGRMPRPVKLGALVRWPRQVVEQWIADGCLPAHSRVLDVKHRTYRGSV